MGTDGKWSCTTCDGRENVRITDVSRTEMVRKKRCESSLVVRIIPSEKVFINNNAFQ